VSKLRSSSALPFVRAHAGGRAAVDRDLSPEPHESRERPTGIMVSFRVSRASLRSRAATALIAAALLPGCANGSGGAGAPGSGIQGRVLSGPSCPVEVQGSPCPPTPVEADVHVIDPGGTEVASGRSDAAGRFRILVEPGTYVVEATSDPGVIGGSKPVQVTVVDGDFTSITVLLDSGIR
jgi:hypothetical protein